MSERSSDDNTGRVAVISALITGCAAILAAVIPVLIGAIHVSTAANVTGTVTAPAKPPVTVTVTAPASAPTASGGSAPSNASVSGQGGQIRDLAVPLTDSSGVDVDKGQVVLNGQGKDIDYTTGSSDNEPEITKDLAESYSTDVTSTKASKQQCVNAIMTHPNAGPIGPLHKGLLFCVETEGDAGIALLQVTQDVSSSKKLYLHEVYWPNASQ